MNRTYFHAVGCLAMLSLLAFSSSAICQSSDGMPQAIKSLLSEYPIPIKAGVTVASADNKSAIRWNEDEALAAASAIKTALLIELVDEHGDHFDDVVPLETILVKDHPCVSHFTAKQQDEIRAGLKGITYRQMGKIMMGSQDASNLVYNAAANTTIAVLGGPETVTKKLHQRSKLLDGLVVRRYMLARRDVPGDNVATAKSLCQVWKWLAKGSIPAMSARKVVIVESCILRADSLHQVRGRHLYKDGSLDSYPITRSYAGTVKIGSKSISYALLLEQPESKDKAKAEAIQELDQLADRLVKACFKSIDGQR